MKIFEVHDISRHVTLVRADTAEDAQVKFETWRDANLADASCRSVECIKLLGPPERLEDMLIAPVYLD